MHSCEPIVIRNYRQTAECCLATCSKSVRDHFIRMICWQAYDLVGLCYLSTNKYYNSILFGIYRELYEWSFSGRRMSRIYNLKDWNGSKHEKRNNLRKGKPTWTKPKYQHIQTFWKIENPFDNNYSFPT